MLIIFWNICDTQSEDNWRYIEIGKFLLFLSDYNLIFLVTVLVLV